MAEQPKYDKAAHAARLIKELGALGVNVTIGKPASSKAKTTTPLVSQRTGKANVPPMAKSSGGPITNPAQRVAAGSRPGPTARYAPFPNRGANRPPIGPPAQSGYSPLPGGSPMMGGLLGGGNLGPIMQNKPMQRQLPNSPILPNMSMGPQEWRPPMVGGPPGMAAPTYANPLIDNQDAAWPTQDPNQQAWNPFSLWSMLQGR